MGTRWSAPWLFVLVLSSTRAHAAPAQAPDAPESRPSRSLRAIPPGREAAARDLLTPVLELDLGELRWLGPTIEVDQIKWWLMRGEEARAILVLSPRELATGDASLSRSFAIEVAWAPEVEPEARELELVAAAVEAVQARDNGQFYTVMLDLFASEERSPALPYIADTSVDAATVHRKWGLKLGGVALLGLFALLVTLRRSKAAAS